MNVKLPDNIDLNNPEFLNAWNLIQRTHQSVFLTGKAGTGKSTFLKYICASTQKKYVVLAPTGIAAVNVGGMTMHSFFKMPLKPLLPDDPDYSPRQIRNTMRFPKEKIKLIKELELIIIDEISMVRADMIDFMDRVLRHFSGNTREPFGGKQLLLVGDVFQLEPVVTSDMRDILRHYYKQFFFFNAKAFDDVKLVPIELTKIYRQTDQAFISILDRVRINRATRQDMAVLNSRFDPNTHDTGDKLVMTLATRRDTVDAINDKHLSELPSEEYTFAGKIDGNFPTQNLPTSLNLVIKKDAQVIFIRNDKEGRWVNGTLGRVCQVDDDGMSVELEDGNVYFVEPAEWENMQYSYDEKKKVVVETVLGTFTQLPVKPAWALTVHKSQGLTFSNVVIDFVGGAFTSGQTYVALSRCTSLEGIRLLNYLSERDVIVNPAIVDFSRQFNNQSLINSALQKAHADELYNRALKDFDEGRYMDCIGNVAEAMKIVNRIEEPLIQRFVSSKLTRFSKLTNEITRLENKVAEQENTLHNLAMEYAQMGKESLDLCGDGDAMSVDSVAIKSSLANYNKALAIWPECVPALVGKADVMVQIDESDEALALYKQALVADNSNFNAHYGMGRLYEATRDTPKAIKAYKCAARADKNSPLPCERLADIYDKIGLDDLADIQRTKAAKLRARGRKKKK